MSTIKLIELIAIKAENQWYRYQQFQLAPLVWRGQTYTYLSFDWSPSTNSLDIDNSGEGSIKILYSDLLDSAIEEQDGLRGAPLIHTVFRGSLDGDKITEHYTIESKSTDDSENAIYLSLQSALNGINGQIPGAVLTRQVFGALPIRNRVGL